MGSILLPEAARTQVPNKPAARLLRVIVTLLERLVKSFQRGKSCLMDNGNRITQPSGAAMPAEQQCASCASLSRRLSVFFWSTSDHNPKAAKFAFLIPGYPAFQQRMVCSEGGNRPTRRNTGCFGVWAAVCDSLSKAECIPDFKVESKRETVVSDCAKTIFFYHVIPIDRSREGLFVTVFEKPFEAVQVTYGSVGVTAFEGVLSELLRLILGFYL